jgi:hypothetical protein
MCSKVRDTFPANARCSAPRTHDPDIPHFAEGPRAAQAGGACAGNTRRGAGAAPRIASGLKAPGAAHTLIKEQAPSSPTHLGAHGVRSGDLGAYRAYPQSVWVHA